MWSMIEKYGTNQKGWKTITMPDDDEHAGTHSARGTYLWSMIETYGTNQKGWKTITMPDDDEHAGTHSAAGTHLWSMIETKQTEEGWKTEQIAKIIEKLKEAKYL